jgi:hypothetical protein
MVTTMWLELGSRKRSTCIVLYGSDGEQIAKITLRNREKSIKVQYDLLGTSSQIYEHYELGRFFFFFFFFWVFTFVQWSVVLFSINK